MKSNDNNLNDDLNMQPWIDPELEARIVAWVAGEASPFEAAELERLAATKPEIALFKQRIERVQDVLKEAVRAEAEPLRLAPERRAKVLETIGAESAPLSDRVAQVQAMPMQTSVWSWRRPRIYFATASLAAACLAVLLVLTSFQKTEYRAVAGMQVQKPSRVVTVQQAVDSDVRSDADLNTHLQVLKSAARANNALSQEVRDKNVVVEKEARNREVAVKAAVELDEKRRAEEKLSEERLRRDAPAARTAVADQLSEGGTKQQQSALVRGDGGRPAPAQTVMGPAPDGAPASQPPTAVDFFANDSAAGAKATTGALTLSKDISNPNLGAVTTGGAMAGIGRVALGADPATPNSSFGVAGAAAAPPAAPAEPSPVFADRVAPAPTNESKVKAESDGTIRLEAFTVQAPKKTDVPSDDRRQVALSDREQPKRSVAVLKEAIDQPVVTTATAELPLSLKGETSAAQQPVSTFSLHVSDVSFRLMQAALNALDRGENPREFPIREEEFYNAFDYGDPRPTTAEKIACRVEQSAHPFLQQRNFLRIAARVAATGRGAGQPLRLTVLLDTSGSMEREDRAAAVRRALEVLVSLLGPNDRLTLIGFARTPRLLAENLRGDQARTALDLAARTPADGGTNLEEALKLGRELALRHRDAAAQNRIVVLTDGAANLGNAEPAQLNAMVEALREQGIAFDACGVGLEGTGDAILEGLTRKGNGRYYVIDSAEAADASFARQLAGAFRPAAENVKLQVRFNPARVGQYRLIGFDAHRLNEQDFRNDAVDAAELAAEEAGVALYQVEVVPDGTGEVGEVFVRFRDAATGQMVERSWPIAYEPNAPRFDRAPPSLLLAGTATLLLEKIDDETAARAGFKLADLAPFMNALRGHYPNQARVQELVTMFGQVRKHMRE